MLGRAAGPQWKGIKFDNVNLTFACPRMCCAWPFWDVLLHPFAAMRPCLHMVIAKIVDMHALMPAGVCMVWCTLYCRHYSGGSAAWRCTCLRAPDVFTRIW